MIQGKNHSKLFVVAKRSFYTSETHISLKIECEKEQRVFNPYCKILESSILSEFIGATLDIFSRNNIVPG